PPTSPLGSSRPSPWNVHLSLLTPRPRRRVWHRPSPQGAAKDVGIRAHAGVCKRDRDLSNSCMVGHVAIEREVIEGTSAHPICEGLAPHSGHIESALIIAVMESLL